MRKTMGRKLKVLELFAGTMSIGKEFQRRGHEVYSIEWDRRFAGIDWYENVINVQAKDIFERFGKPDVIWASPDCSSYSVAAISKHRRRDEDGNLVPISDYAKYCDKVNRHLLRLLLALTPSLWFVENPRGGYGRWNLWRVCLDIPSHTASMATSA